jgi:hypothetical protein
MNYTGSGPLFPLRVKDSVRQHPRFMKNSVSLPAEDVCRICPFDTASACCKLKKSAELTAQASLILYNMVKLFLYY